MALHLFRQLLQHINLPGARLAPLEPLHDLLRPLAALAAGRALPAGLVLVEAGEAADRADDVGALIHDDDRRGAEAGLAVLQGVEVHELGVAGFLGEDGGGGAAGDDGFEVVPAAADTAAVLLDQFFERDGHFFFDRARVIDVAGDAEEFGACIALAAEAVEPVGPAAGDGWGNGDGLDVGDCRGATEQADGGGEWRLQAWLSGLAFERFDEGSFFSTDVRAHAAVDVDVKIVP